MIGQKLSHYLIIEQIGAGGMGVVYRAHDEQLDRDVAIKVLPPRTLGDETPRRRFRQEALSLAKLNHPNIATVHEFNSQDGTDFLVTEYIPGITLNHKIAGGPLPAEETIALGLQLAQGLAAAHEQGIVHRDLKPSNLRLTSDGRLKILDFGLARLMPHASDLGVTATLTQSREVTGTLPYMAPEQLRGEPADARTDLWAAGAVLYEMATGKRPFQGDTNPLLINSILNQKPETPCKLKKGIPVELENVILKALNKAPARRYQTARQLGLDLGVMRAVAPARTNLLAGNKRYAALAFAVIVIAALGYLIFSRGEKVVLIRTDPAGAGVTVAGQNCRTPCDLRLRPGRYELRVEWDGYLPVIQQVSVTSGTKSLQTVRLAEMAVARPPLLPPPPSALPAVNVGTLTAVNPWSETRS